MSYELINWYQTKHVDYLGENPISPQSERQLQHLQSEIIRPLQTQLGEVHITYGYTSHSLLRWILKHSPGDMAPDIDQHASMELNSKGKRICKRDGAACDFYVKGYENRMDEVAKYICTHIAFDRLYFYGKNKPIHISIGPENSRYALIRQARSDGLRVNTKSAKGNATQTLFDDL